MKIMGEGWRINMNVVFKYQMQFVARHAVFVNEDLTFSRQLSAFSKSICTFKCSMIGNVKALDIGEKNLVTQAKQSSYEV